jgi:DMSO/TMAO reductase YedYZ molybdopterin-dependent catalytic subunit
MRHKYLLLTRDWLFDRLINLLVSDEWELKIVDFKKSKKRDKRNNLGLTDPESRIISLDIDGGTPRILIHELGHAIFEEPLEDEKHWQNQVNPEGENRSFFDWEELKTLEFEKYFYNSLSKNQIQVLKDFITEAHIRKRRSVNRR